MSPVRNIESIGRTKPIPIKHIIPPSAAIPKVTIDVGSEEIDVTDLITTANFNVGVVTTVGSFELNFLDPIKTNYNKISNFNDVYIYSDYGSEATTKRFRFKIESVGYSDSQVNLKGRGIGMILLEKSIIYQSLDGDGNLTSKNKSTILQEILEDNFSNITDYSQISTNSTEIERNYGEIPFNDIIEDLCGDNYYFYLDYDLVPHYFEKGSVQNSTEAIGEVNMLTVNDNADNAEDVYTRVRVYGKKEGDVIILATSESNTTNTNGIQKDYIINNSSITTSTQAQQIADAEYDRLLNPPKISDITSMFLPTLAQGEKLFIGISEENIEPVYYNIKEFTINIDNTGDIPFCTQVIVESKRSNVSTSIKDLTQTQIESIENDNPNDLDSSKIITFGVDTGTHDGTEISEGYLKVAKGNSQGTWISPIFTLSNQPTGIEARWSGERLVQEYTSTSSQLWFSLDGGTTWRYNPPVGTTATVPTGKDLRIKIVLNQSEAQVKIVGVYYKF